MTSEIKRVRLDLIDHNPRRRTETYPFDEAKLEALMRSMSDTDVGMWEGVIVRKAGRRYQQAFGHHRTEAARRLGMKTVPVIVRDLSDLQMLKFMAHENGEDYRSQFLVLLETWEAGVDEFAHYSAQKSQAIDIANVLGWTRMDDRRNQLRISKLGEACHMAHQLIQAGHLSYADFEGLTAHDARELAQQTQRRIKEVETMAKKTQRPHKDVVEAKKQVAKGAKVTAKQVREKRGTKGEIRKADIRGKVDENIHVIASKAKKKSPLLAAFANRLGGKLDKLLRDDALARELQGMVDALPNVELAEDIEAIENVQFDLKKIAKRANNWHTALHREKVVPIKGVPQLGRDA